MKKRDKIIVTRKPSVQEEYRYGWNSYMDEYVNKTFTIDKIYEALNLVSVKECFWLFNTDLIKLV